MNNSTLTQLKILIERSVRPIRTSMTRKLRMREELLSHMLAAFDQELAKSTDEPDALERTILRFGNPAELTKQLEQSLPKPDWWYWSEYLVGFPEGDDTLRRAARHALISAVLFLPCLPLFIVTGRMREWPILVGFPIGMIIYTFLNHWMRQAMFMSPMRRWGIAIPVLLAAGLAMPIITFVVCLTISGNTATAWDMVKSLIPSSLILTPIALFVWVYVTSFELRQDEQWRALLSSH